MKSRLKTGLPELLSAVCNHPDCPEWLADGIWDLIFGQDMSHCFSAPEFRAALEAIENHRQQPEAGEDILDSEVLR